MSATRFGSVVREDPDLELLRYFKEAVLREWEGKVNTADQIGALFARLELGRLRRPLAILIPEPPGVGHGE